MNRRSDRRFNSDSNVMAREVMEWAVIRNRLKEIIAPLEERVERAKLQYSQRPLLKANYPVFNDLHRDFYRIIKDNWTEINYANLRTKILALHQDPVSGLESRLSVIVDQMDEILSIPDDVILDKLKREIRQKYENYFGEIDQRNGSIPVTSDLVAGEKEYYQYLRKEYLTEIGQRLGEADDHRTITSLRLLINSRRRALAGMVDKIEKLAAGEILDDSFGLSDLSEDDSADSEHES